MFNIFKRRFFKRNTLTDKEIFNIEYDSYEFLKTVVNKIKPYISEYCDMEIDFNAERYNPDIKYDNMFDSPFINSDLIIHNNLSIDKLDELADIIIKNWQYDDSADVLAEDICKSCNENNSYNVSISFVFTNFCPNFKQPGLIIYWKTN